MTTIDVENKSCVTCGDLGEGELTCNGCQKSFCWGHVNDHRQDILKQMDDITQNDLLKYQWNDQSYGNRLFDQINQWEKNSINKIEITANKIRDDLKSLIKQSKDQFQTSIQQISEQIHQSQQSNNYSERNIQQWTQQLNNIQQQIQTCFNIQLTENEQTSFIPLIKIEQKSNSQLSQKERGVKRPRNEVNNSFSDQMDSDNDRFDKVLGNAKFYEENLVVINGINSRSFISGANLYSNGQHCLQFFIEDIDTTKSSCLFGIITSSACMKENVSEMTSVYGVWSSGYHVKCGERSGFCGDRRWNQNHNVKLTMDCDKKQIQIENKRINWCQVFDIDLNSCPLPWKFLTIVKGYQLRIKNHP